MAADSNSARNVVITGASSGIGLASALAFARRGDRVVLAARGRPALEQAARACARLGAEVLAVPTDVGDPEQVERLAAAAERRFGGIDVWVNNAAVAMFGRFEELPPIDVGRLVDVNVKGYAWGAQSALRRFRRRGSGVLVNVGSANGRIGSPMTSCYVMTKFAVDGLTQSLRMELAGQPAIRVCTVLPAPIDTPLWRNAANHSGEAIGPAGPAFAAEHVAEAVLRCADTPRRELWVGWTGRLGWVVRQSSGSLYEAVGARLYPAAYRRGRAAAPTPGNLHAPMGGPARIGDGWATRDRRPGRARRLAGVSAATALLAAALLRQGQRD